MNNNAQGEFKKLLFTSIMTVLFAFVVLFFFYGFASENNIDTSTIDEEGAFKFSEINQSLVNVQEKAEDMKEVFSSSDEEEVGFLEGVFATGTVFFTLPLEMIKFVIDLFDLIIIDGFNYIFQSSALGYIILSVIISLIIFGIIFAIIRLVKQGE